MQKNNSVRHKTPVAYIITEQINMYLSQTVVQNKQYDDEMTPSKYYAEIL